MLSRNLLMRVCTLTVAVVTTLVLAFSSGGCGSIAKKVQEHLTLVKGIISDFQEAEKELNNHWNLGLAEQKDIGDSLDSFRKAIAKGEDKIDEVDPPEPCREVHRETGRLLSRGRELAMLMSESCDYLESVSSVASSIEDLLGKMNALIEKNEIAVGLPDLFEESDKIYDNFASIVTPAEFQSIREELEKFIEEIRDHLTKAMKTAGIQTGTTEERGSVAEEQEEPSSSVTKAVGRILDDLPEIWGQVAGRIAVLMNDLRVSSGVAAKQIEIDNVLSNVNAMISELDKRYALHGK